MRFFEELDIRDPEIEKKIKLGEDFEWARQRLDKFGHNKDTEGVEAWAANKLLYFSDSRQKKRRYSDWLEYESNEGRITKVVVIMESGVFGANKKATSGGKWSDRSIDITVKTQDRPVEITARYHLVNPKDGIEKSYGSVSNGNIEVASFRWEDLARELWSIKAQLIKKDSR